MQKTKKSSETQTALWLTKINNVDENGRQLDG